jgi:hypothetical protein
MTAARLGGRLLPGSSDPDKGQCPDYPASAKKGPKKRVNLGLDLG